MTLVQLIEFIDVTFSLGKHCLIGTSRSSDVPSTAKTWMFSSTYEVICNSCTTEILSLGNRTTISTDLRPRTASIAALPVSPDVPTLKNLLELDESQL